MAKKKKNAGETAEKRKGGKLLSILIVFFILLIWVITFAFLIKMDVGNLGTSLRPMIKNVPVIKYLLPSVPPEQEAWEENYPYDTMAQAVEKIIALEEALDALSKEDAEHEQTILELQAENIRLEAFEKDQEAFAKRVEEFDRKVVFNSKAPDIAEYKAFYEGIYPETAEKIYRLVVEKIQLDEAIQVEAKRLSSMKPGNAAKILEEMTGSLDLVASYLLAMKTADSAAIVEKMDALYAARIMQKIADTNEEKLRELQAQMSK